MATTTHRIRGADRELHQKLEPLFGTCPGCRRTTGDARLQALPFASLCLACQKRHDIAAVSRWLAAQQPAGRRASSTTRFAS
jgi:RNA polymerase-binding transcription factor DksA